VLLVQVIGNSRALRCGTATVQSRFFVYIDAEWYKTLNIKIMSLFGLFTRKTPENQLREKIRKEFDIAAQEALKQGLKDPFLGAMMVQASVGSLYQELKKSTEMEILCNLQGIDYQTMLEEECNKILEKYLE
jgi:hypothetical protein